MTSWSGGPRDDVDDDPDGVDKKEEDADEVEEDKEEEGEASNTGFRVNSMGSNGVRKMGIWP